MVARASAVTKQPVTYVLRFFEMRHCGPDRVAVALGRLGSVAADLLIDIRMLFRRLG